ncbi:hypothetical protein, partial [Clostridium saccharobutylicum]
MVKFEFLRNKDVKYESYIISVNGIEDKLSHGNTYRRGAEDEYSWIRLHSEEVINLIMHEKIVDLLKEVEEIEIPLEEKYIPATITENDSADAGINLEKEKCFVFMKFVYDFAMWARIYAIPDIVNEIEEVCKKYNNISFELIEEDDPLNGFKLIKRIECTDNSFEDELISLGEKIKPIFEEVQILLQGNIEGISFEFNLNESIKTAYKQYLVYFVQFLEDVGIDSESEMKSEADRILFRVIPKDKTVALKNIRDLLNIYIDFIDNKEIEIYEDYNNLAVSQLKANVLHLKSQLILAQTIIEQKQITIDLLKNTKVIMP